MVEVISQQKNPLFARNEVVIIVKQATVPSHKDAKMILAKEFGADEEVIRVKKIDSRFGSTEFQISANIYDSKEEFDRVVKKTKQEVEAEKKAEEERLAKKAEEKEAKKAAEEAAKAAPEEGVPSEEGKTEKPAEEKSAEEGDKE